MSASIQYAIRVSCLAACMGLFLLSIPNQANARNIAHVASKKRKCGSVPRVMRPIPKPKPKIRRCGTVSPRTGKPQKPVNKPFRLHRIHQLLLKLQAATMSSTPSLAMFSCERPFAISCCRGLSQNCSRCRFVAAYVKQHWKQLCISKQQMKQLQKANARPM